MKLKVCGMRDIENLQQLIPLAPDFIGFIFYSRSPRYISFNEPLEQFICNIQPSIKKVGVFVNAYTGEIVDKIERYQLDFVQLHGTESPLFCKLLKKATDKPIICVFHIQQKLDYELLNQYTEFCEYFLFETASSQYGGSGEKFDWNALAEYNLQTPFFLSGGISPDDAELIKNLPFTPYAIDINSKFETEPAMKNIPQIETFFKKMRQTI